MCRRGGTLCDPSTPDHAEELRRRNYAESTIHTYIQTVEHFSRHFHCSPDQLGPEHIREYQAALFTRWKLAPNTVTQRLAALRFFYVQVLKRGWSVAETPYPKKILRLPQVLSQEEVARLIDAAESPFHRILLMTLYATGARRAEVAHLRSATSTASGWSFIFGAARDARTAM